MLQEIARPLARGILRLHQHRLLTPDASEPKKVSSSGTPGLELSSDPSLTVHTG